jgi:hypothetical protein
MPSTVPSTTTPGWDQARTDRGDRHQQKDSNDTVDTLIADLAAARNSSRLADFGADHADKLAEWLASRQPKLVTAAHWEAIDRFERAAGERHGRPRVKLPTLAIAIADRRHKRS